MSYRIKTKAFDGTVIDKYIEDFSEFKDYKKTLENEYISDKKKAAAAEKKRLELVEAEKKRKKLELEKIIIANAKKTGHRVRRTESNGEVKLVLVKVGY